MMKGGFLSGRKGRGQHGNSEGIIFILLLTSSAGVLKVKEPG